MQQGASYTQTLAHEPLAREGGWCTEPLQNKPHNQSIPKFTKNFKLTRLKVDNELMMFVYRLGTRFRVWFLLLYLLGHMRVSCFRNFLMDTDLCCGASWATKVDIDHPNIM